MDREQRSLSLARLDGHVPAVGLRAGATDRKAEPGPAGVATARAVHAVEALEDPFEIAGRDPDAVIAYEECEPVVDDLGADLHGLARARVLDRVVEQVHERTPHLAPVAGD